VARRGARAVTAGPGGDVELEDVRELPAEEALPGAPSERLRGRLRVGSERHDVLLPTVHGVAVTNLLLAATAVIALGGEPGAVAGALSGVTPPPGRLETVGYRGGVSARVDTAHNPAALRTALTAGRARTAARGGEPGAVRGALSGVTPPPGRLETVGYRGGVSAMVDTAHNPAALRTALTAVRARTAGRVLLVVGAGGERDRAKRAPMGEIAAELADLVILTDDNPRREPPDRIRAEVREGCPGCVEIPRRADAIRAAWEMAREGDVVLVAGKGDETVQLVGTRSVPH